DFDNTLIPRKSTLLITLHLPAPLTTDAKNTTNRNVRRAFWLIQVVRAIFGKRRAGGKTSKDNTVGKRCGKTAADFLAQADTKNVSSSSMGITNASSLFALFGPTVFSNAPLDRRHSHR